jgi:hypothetical protein
MSTSKVKVSVILPGEVHRSLKHMSVERGTSIQEVMESAALTVIQPEAPTPPMTSKEIRSWLARFKTVLESRNDLAIQNCTAAIRATENWLAERRNHDIRDSGSTASVEDLKPNVKTSVVNEEHPGDSTLKWSLRVI